MYAFAEKIASVEGQFMFESINIEPIRAEEAKKKNQFYIRVFHNYPYLYPGHSSQPLKLLSMRYSF